MLFNLSDDEIKELAVRCQEWDWHAKETVALAHLRQGFEVAKALGFTVHLDCDHEAFNELNQDEVTVLEPEEIEGEPDVE